MYRWCLLPELKVGDDSTGERLGSWKLWHLNEYATGWYNKEINTQDIRYFTNCYFQWFYLILVQFICPISFRWKCWVPLYCASEFKTAGNWLSFHKCFMTHIFNTASQTCSRQTTAIMSVRLNQQCAVLTWDSECVCVCLCVFLQHNRFCFPAEVPLICCFVILCQNHKTEPVKIQGRFVRPGEKEEREGVCRSGRGGAVSW